MSQSNLHHVRFIIRLREKGERETHFIDLEIEFADAGSTKKPPSLSLLLAVDMSCHQRRILSESK
jgi:hypothetical protein